ncbi:MAG: murein biosynthesis integral membrane protein MurJ, partial [Spirochaetaceae bacterium]|nr:murein biosynthesis integral membrane protein MurJ [Spirochaetaceae bacterium]
MRPTTGKKPPASSRPRSSSESGKASGEGDCSIPREQEVERKTWRLSLMTLASRILGLFREMTKAWFLGTGWLSDAFASAFILPNFIRRLFTEGALSTSFVPGFKRYLQNEDDMKAGNFASSSLTILSILGFLATMVGLVFAPALARLFGTDQTETTLLIRIMFPFLAFASIAALFQGILNSEGIFGPSALAPILFNLIAIAVPWVFSPWLG